MTRPASRDRRIWRAVLTMVAAGTLLVLLGTLFQTYGQQRGWGFSSGLGQALMLGGPLAFAALGLLAYRRMDEYGRSLHARAAGFAFVVSMALAAAGFMLETTAGHPRLPLWALYTAGMASWGLATAYLSLRRR
jgi:hypothetical protein